MPEETATLRDTVAPGTTAPGDATATTTVDDKTTQTSAATTTQVVADKDAQELGQILLDSGFTKDNVNSLLGAPKALQAIQYMIKNDPQEFIRVLERDDPRAAAIFQDKITDLYVERHQAPSGTSKTTTTTDGASPELMNEIRQLREKTNRLESQEVQRQQQAQTAQLKSRFDARVDDLLSKDEVKNLKLTKAETAALKAQLNSELATDPAAVQRVSNGNLSDVPRVFGTLVTAWANDKKAAAEGEKTEREKAARRTFPDFSAGPSNPLQGIPSNFADSWDATENALAQALERMNG